MKVYKALSSLVSGINAVYRTFLPSANQKLLKKFKKQAEEIIALESEYANLKDEELKGKTQYFRSLLAEGKTLDQILVEAFATVREVSWRVRREKHYQVQLIGGIALHSGMIAEMDTGEGKTLVATLPAYLNALANKGVHVITVNDYLAARDAQAMGKIYEFLGLTVGCLAHAKGYSKPAYDCDITYGTNHDFVFDYLRDNMAKNLNQIVQRPYYFSIIDEVDNILIDEARTPCIISGEAMEASELCRYAQHIILQLNQDDYEKDEKSRSANFTETGLAHLEEIFKNEGLITGNETLFDEQYVLLIHHLNQALKATHMFHIGIQYIVHDDQVLIVDESTGRVMEGRRFSDGLHQALEAKENVEIRKENQTLATITYQKFFELYPKKSGMTGTAVTESEELNAVYGLNVLPIPPNRPSKRKILDDRIYRTLAEKIDAVVEIVKQCQDKGQPILIGTSSVEKSELFSQALTNHGIEHQVLNAKNHAREADIIAQAGVLGAVTIATNMAGRGTDIKLGGSVSARLKHIINPNDEIIKQLELETEEDGNKVRSLGGLYVLGTERHESRRIDNQLLGRCGRQGDPGTALFVVSLDDQLMQIFGGKTLNKWLGKGEYGEVIEHPLVSRAMSKAQKKVEAFHFDSRKNVLKYDAVINDQSKTIYAERMYFMQNASVADNVLGIIDHFVDDLMENSINNTNSASNMHLLLEKCHTQLNIEISENTLEMHKNNLAEYIHTLAKNQFFKQKEELGEEYFERVCKDVCLSTLDMLWRQHLTKIENLRSGIGLRSYGQQDPLNEFKREAFNMFENMLVIFRATVTSSIMHHKPEFAMNYSNENSYHPEDDFMDWALSHSNDTQDQKNAIEEEESAINAEQIDESNADVKWMPWQEYGPNKTDDVVQENAFMQNEHDVSESAKQHDAKLNSNQTHWDQQNEHAAISNKHDSIKNLKQEQEILKYRANTRDSNSKKTTSKRDDLDLEQERSFSKERNSTQVPPKKQTLKQINSNSTRVEVKRESSKRSSINPVSSKEHAQKPTDTQAKRAASKSSIRQSTIDHAQKPTAAHAERAASKSSIKQSTIDHAQGPADIHAKRAASKSSIRQSTIDHAQKPTDTQAKRVASKSSIKQSLNKEQK